MKIAKPVLVGAIQPADLLREWLVCRLQKDALAWLFQTHDNIQRSLAENEIYTAFATAPKRLSKNDLNLTAKELSAAAQCVAGWAPHDWSVDQAARSYLLLSLPGDLQAQQHIIKTLFSYAELRESIALLQTLPLLPNADSYYDHAKEATRSSSDSVFNALALNNSYPSRFFSEHDWNQMVLKAFFLESDTALIYGYKQRFNSSLSLMFSDFINERCAAGRPVPARILHACT